MPVRAPLVLELLLCRGRFIVWSCEFKCGVIVQVAVPSSSSSVTPAAAAAVRPQPPPPPLPPPADTDDRAKASARSERKQLSAKADTEIGLSELIIPAEQSQHEPLTLVTLPVFKPAAVQATSQAAPMDLSASDSSEDTRLFIPTLPPPGIRASPKPRTPMSLKDSVQMDFISSAPASAPVPTSTAVPILAEPMKEPEQTVLPSPTVAPLPTPPPPGKREVSAPELSAALDLTNPDDYLYDLTAVLKHQGGAANYGHYTAWIKDDITGVWWLFDDARVSKIGKE